MPKTLNAARTHCMFCNSLSHVAANCNSNMNGHRQLLTKIGKDFMLDDTLPDFNSFPLNELRFIASVYDEFQKIPNKQYMKRMYMYFDRPCLVDYLYTPIPATLTKSRIIKQLKDRWRLYAEVRATRNHGKPEDEDCPICMDCMTICIWSPPKLKWDRLTTKTPLPNARFDGNIRTPCGHTFCGSCWEMHVNANSKPEYYDRFDDERTGRMILSCPMCRHKMLVVV